MALSNHTDKSAVEHVLERKKAGSSEEEIRQELINRGWNNDQANLIIVKAGLTNLLSGNTEQQQRYRKLMKEYQKLIIWMILGTGIIYLMWIFWPR